MERTRTPTTTAADPRPGERLFSRRELLLTSWTDRFKLSPGEQVKFGYQRFILGMELHNAGKSIASEAVTEAATLPAEAPTPRRKPLPVPLPG